MGATNEALAIIDDDIIFDPAYPEGGTVSVKSIAGQTVTITVTPGEGYSVKLSDIIVQKLQDPSQAQARRRTPGIADRLTVSGVQESDVAADYTFEVPTGYAGALVNVTFTSKIDPGYYVIHNSSKGYLKVSGANVTLSTDGTFRSGDLFGASDSNGNSIWYITSDGYLQNEYFYLNVANNKTLYLSVTPVTKWRTEDIENQTKKHLKINDGTNDLYLCNDNDAITLKASPTNYYNACPVTVDEVSWDTTPYADTFNLTLQSPQLVTYLRAYFKQKINYSFTPDAGEPVAQTDHERRVYATIAYKEGGSGKGTNWDIDASGVLYNKKSSGDAEFTATYNILPADPVAKAAHSTPVTKDIKYKVQQKVNLPSYDANMDYLLYSISATDDYRYPYDDGSPNDSDHPVKPDGRGGVDSSKPSVLTDPLSDGSGRNPQISWKITIDSEGFYTFQNKSSGKYLYYDETAHASNDFGTLCVGANSTDNRAKFRLYKTKDDEGYDCYYIIPYSKLFAVYLSNGLADGLYAALNINDYSSENPAVISLSKPDGNSTWAIYKYEAAYRVRSDFSIIVETTNTAEETGDYKFSAEGWYGKCISQSPDKGYPPKGLIINGTYKDASDIDYLWTVTGLDSNIDITDGTLTTGTWTKTTTGDANNRKLVINVPSMPVSTISGVIELKIRGYSAPNQNVKTTADDKKKTIAFTILGNGAVTFTDITSLSQIESSNGAYRLIEEENSNFAYSSTNKPSTTSFTGILEGNGVTISGLSAPLFETLSNGTVRNVNLSGVDINNHAGPTGAIAGTADGGSRIYNVGILDGEVSSSDDYCGGIVGKLDGSARVINCFSYANITGGTTVAGIVGYNNYQSTMTDLRTMVVNCMFYGDITSGTAKYPVYGGKKISNADASGINNYNYFLETATFDDSYSSIDNYNCSWPVGERYLTRYEIYRNILNSNRRLCTWWVRGVNNTAPTDADVESVGIAKWVLDPAIAPYPILKTWGKYPSVVNPDPDQRVDPTTKAWVNRVDASSHWEAHAEPDTEGQILGTITVNIDGGAHHTATDSKPINITAMDKEYKDYCYGKIQLPYFNEIFGNPAATTWSAKYGDNYGDYVVTGWKITNVTTDGTISDYNSFEADWESGYNFADRHCTDKDLFDTSGRVFAQGGFYYVPEGVISIDIEAYWGKAVYLYNEEGYLDRVGNASTSFVSSGTLPTDIGNGKTIKTTLSGAVSALKTIQESTINTVYDQAIVLVGNYQNNSFHSNITVSGSDYDTKAKPFTIMSADFDFDNEPDFCFQAGMSDGGRINTHPIRFDFLYLPDLTMAARASTDYYGMRIFCPQGHFEVTETSYLYITQFEYDMRPGTDDSYKIFMKHVAPMIINGGEFLQMVSAENLGTGYSQASVGETASWYLDRTLYFLMGGNLYMKAFTPGTHGNRRLSTRHCAVNAIGGEYPEFYLSGMFNADFYNKTDNPHAYLDGGYFGIVAGAGMESVGGKDETTGGDVTFIINHSLIDEFYGGGINANRPVTGTISVTVDNSYVKKFCGGPKVGDMSSSKTITTSATGTTFDEFYGGGNGGTNNERRRIKDSNGATDAPTYDNRVSAWGGNSGYGFNSFAPLTYDNGYQTEFEFELLPDTRGTNKVVKRTYSYWASFSRTTVAPVTNDITDCTFNGNFYGGGNLGAVEGPANATTPVVSSTLQGNTVVHGSAYGAGFSASIPSFQVHNPSTVAYPYRDFAGFIHDGSLDYGETSYTWIHDVPAEWNISPAPATNNDNRTFTYGDKSYVYTPVSLSGLGTVTGNVELTLKGNTIVECKVFKEDGTVDNVKIGGVYGGGAQSAVSGNTTVNLQENAQVYGNVFGGGDEGVVEGTATVNIQDPPTSGNSGSGSGSGGESGGGSGN